MLMVDSEFKLLSKMDRMGRKKQGCLLKRYPHSFLALHLSGDIDNFAILVFQIGNLLPACPCEYGLAVTST